MVTISDVAREAGVSLSTASRALNNSVVVSQEKKDRVVEAVKKLGYRPIRISSARRAQQNKVILVVSAMLHNQMFDSIRQTAEELGYQTAIAYAGEDCDEGYRNALELIKMMPSGLLCGLIFYHNACKDKALWEEFCEYPLVQIGEFRKATPLVRITIDDHDAAYDMTNYLIAQGYKRIAFVSSITGKDYTYGRQRSAGFRDAMADAGLPCDESLIFDADYTLDGGMDAARRLLKLEQLPEAVFCDSDYMALGCISELQEQGLSVPRDIAVCGFDNIEASEYCNPSLTTIAQPFDEMGAEAVRMLDLLSSGEIATGRKMVAAHNVMIRKST